MAAATSAATPLLLESVPLIPTPPPSRSSKIRERIAYYVPITHWLPNYSPRTQLKGDFLAGLTLACLMVPQSISYATTLAHVSPLAGLFSSSIPAVFYTVFGSSRHMNVTPEGTLSLIIGQTIKALNTPGASPEQKAKEAVTITTVITFQNGLFAFLLGFLRLGFLDVILSKALLRGFISAVGIVIAVYVMCFTSYGILS
jgi:MFS superfamily sulfate permease-like transporter